MIVHKHRQSIAFCGTVLIQLMNSYIAVLIEIFLIPSRADVTDFPDENERIHYCARSSLSSPRVPQFYSDWGCRTAGKKFQTFSFLQGNSAVTLYGKFWNYKET